jgi:hypothetical protein
MQKLYVIVRSDIAPGAQIAQSCHACGAFALAFPDEHRTWLTGPSNIVCLAAPNEATLADLLALAQSRQIPTASFREPDFGDELTAIALGEGAQLIVSCLPLALKERKRAA